MEMRLAAQINLLHFLREVYFAVLLHVSFLEIELSYLCEFMSVQL